MKAKFLSLSIGLFCLSISISNAEEVWYDLFDGKTLNGWRANENRDSFSVQDGMIVAVGERSHLFYEGPVNRHDFKNFEFKADIMTFPLANSGIYFHTKYQDSGWPDHGFEAQINNTHLGGGDYRELKKTGSLYSVRNQYKTIVNDNEWFTMHIVVKNNHVQIKVNDALVVDYVEPAEPLKVQGRNIPRLSRGTFALQGHDPLSKVYFKNIQVKPLPDELDMDDEPIPYPIVDKTYMDILSLNAANFPIVDFHVHLKGNLTLEDALAKSHDTGIYYGIAVNCGLGFPITDDAGIDRFLDSMKSRPVFIGMQAEGREWVKMFSKEAINRFDYVFTDAMTFTDHRGKRVRIWIPEEVDIDDPQEFMEMYVDRILSVLNNEPIDIYVNATFLPDVIAGRYDELWTDARMKKVIQAAVDNGIAIEINDRYRIPSAAFIQLAKQMGAKFSFGTNNADEHFGRLEYCIQMMKECGLTANDMFLPKKLDVRLK